MYVACTVSSDSIQGYACPKHLKDSCIFKQKRTVPLTFTVHDIYWKACVFSRNFHLENQGCGIWGHILHSMKVLWKIKKSKNRVYIRYIEGPTRMALDEGFIKRWKKSVSIPGRNVHPSNILTLSQFRETKGKRWLLWVFLFCLERIRFQGRLAGPKEMNRSRARSHYGPQRTRPAGHVYTQRREELNYETKEVEN